MSYRSEGRERSDRSERGGRSEFPLDCKVYVGELGTNGTRHELEEAFGSYGRVRNVWVATNPPGFAFVMFEDPRDAKEACRALDGKMICGRRVRVEMSTGKTRHDRERYARGGGGGERYGNGYRSGGGRGGGGPRRDFGRDARREDRDDYRRRRYSRSRSRSASPVRRRDGHVRDGGRPRTPPSHSPDSSR